MARRHGFARDAPYEGRWARETTRGYEGIGVSCPYQRVEEVHTNLSPEVV